jgi:UDP-glucose 4-epimerase
VHANLLALNLNDSDTFNVGTGQETTVKKLTELILEVSESNITTQTSKKNNFEQRRSSLDNKKLKEALEWSPQFSLKEGLSETFIFFKNNEN